MAVMVDRGLLGTVPGSRANRTLLRVAPTGAPILHPVPGTRRESVSKFKTSFKIDSRRMSGQEKRATVTNASLLRKDLSPMVNTEDSKLKVSSLDRSLNGLMYPLGRCILRPMR